MPVRGMSCMQPACLRSARRMLCPRQIEASLQLSELVLIGAGVPDDAARHLIEVRRQAEQAALDKSWERRSG
jgi:hypothetical protein